LPHGSVAGRIVIAHHRDTASFKHEPSLTIQEVGRNAIAARDHRNALPAIQRFLDDPKLLG
jgi:hypothetical protein